MNQQIEKDNPNRVVFFLAKTNLKTYPKIKLQLPIKSKVGAINYRQAN